MKELIEYMSALPHGRLSECNIAHLVPLLKNVWDEFEGSDSDKMAAYKIDRLEDVSWNPPKLNLTIERHGGTVQGSTRAELHEWVLDLDQKTATCCKGGFRQVKTRQKKIDVKPLAAEIAQLIIDQKKGETLQWNDDGSVMVLIGKILPEIGSPEQTKTNRRKRFRNEVERIIQKSGWKKIRANVYSP